MNNSEKSIIYLNGEFCSSTDAKISPLDSGLQFGDGLFETIRIQQNKVLFLDDHINRLTKSAQTLKINIPSINWESTINELIAKNELSGSIVKLKIIITRGISDTTGLPQANQPTVLLTCIEYSPPTQQQYENGWKLHTYKTGFAPPLAMHKSLNYLYYMTARQKAFDNKSDDAIILDPGENVAETTIASIFYKKNDAYFTPQSKYQLPGITIKKIIGFIEKSNIDIVYKPTTINDLQSAQSVFITNSLIGVMPINTIDSIPVSDIDSTLAKKMRNYLFDCSD